MIERSYICHKQLDGLEFHVFVLGVLVVKLQSHHGGRSKETTAPNQPMIQSSIFAK